jgi:hypothetical protein
MTVLRFEPKPDLVEFVRGGGQRDAVAQVESSIAERSRAMLAELLALLAVQMTHYRRPPGRAKMARK